MEAFRLNFARGRLVSISESLEATRLTVVLALRGAIAVISVRSGLPVLTDLGLGDGPANEVDRADSMDVIEGDRPMSKTDDEDKVEQEL